ncbi:MULTISPECIES: transposase family protein [unclassified Simplicispira]|uniref:transposase family protein n=1 Tax=unclassified Simplicispira TaxID=2630407 RepID=UPI002100CD11|nr:MULTISPECIES: transposase family protein [unclassified Simplicispira]
MRDCLNAAWRLFSHCTLMFEALALALAREMSVAARARILHCADNALWRQIDVQSLHCESQRAICRRQLSPLTVFTAFTGCS